MSLNPSLLPEVPENVQTSQLKFSGFINIRFLKSAVEIFLNNY